MSTIHLNNSKLCTLDQRRAGYLNTHRFMSAPDVIDAWEYCRRDNDEQLPHSASGKTLVFWLVRYSLFFCLPVSEPDSISAAKPHFLQRRFTSFSALAHSFFLASTICCWIASNFSFRNVIKTSSYTSVSRVKPLPYRCVKMKISRFFLPLREHGDFKG